MKQIPERPTRAGIGIAAVILLVSACVDESAIDPELTTGVCPSCDIEVREVWASIPRDPNVLDAGTWIEWGDSIWSMQGFAGHAMIVYSLRSGESRRLARRGDGPGEFQGIHGGFLDRSGDTLLVAEATRVSFLTAGGRFVRSVSSPIPIPVRSVRQGPHGEIVIAHPYGRPDEHGQTDRLHVLNRDGVLISSFAPGSAVGRPRLWPGEDSTQVWLLSDSDGGFTIEGWDVAEEAMTRQLSVEPPWWYDPKVTPQLQEHRARAGALSRLPSKVTSLREADGMLWVTAVHPAARTADFDPDVYDPARDYDSVLMVIDRSSGAIVTATVMTDRLMGGWTSSGMLQTLEHDSGGHPRHRLHEVRLVGPDGQLSRTGPVSPN
jgi:hypothetical protein